MARGSWRPENLCRHCACNPCQCDTFEQRRAAGQERYDERNEPAPAPKKKSKPKKTKAKPTLSKKKFIANLRKKNPTISDGQIKTALRKAGYPTGCAVIAILLLATPVGGAIWGGYEIARAVWG